MRQTFHRLLQVDFVRFCVVGASGFLINAALLLALKEYIPSFFAQLIAGEIALFSNFILHHFWTYKHTFVSKTPIQLILQFHATSWIAVLGSACIVGFLLHFLHWNEIVALVISSIIVLFWNFAWSRYVIWRKESPAEEADAA